MKAMDWSDCADVESIPGKVSGAWVVKGTRVPADALVANARDGYSAKQIVTEMFPTVPLERACRVLDFAGIHEPRPA